MASGTQVMFDDDGIPEVAEGVVGTKVVVGWWARRYF